MDRMLQRQLGRRDVLRRAAIGAGAVGLGMSAGGRFAAPAWAQDASPAASPAASAFDAAACFKPFGDVKTVQYEKVGDPPYKIALSNSYIGNVWRTQMIKMAKAYSQTPDIAPLISNFEVNTADREPSTRIRSRWAASGHSSWSTRRAARARS
jgi:hypothetical protein